MKHLNTPIYTAMRMYSIGSKVTKQSNDEVWQYLYFYKFLDLKGIYITLQYYIHSTAEVTDVHKCAKCSVHDRSSSDQAGFCYDVCTVPASLKCAWQLNGEHTNMPMYFLSSIQTHRLDCIQIIWTYSYIHNQFILKYSHTNSVSETKKIISTLCRS